ncbi:transporter substrate-binding domain-containing protein [Terrilactibacillus laevilacticus]|uniref:transporter substrate-binding domain-containing protein n=1 Tax=Terrilactibacillus laevilacticus TaxID=1380157 RepID=UPI0011479C8C|nr:transporter substrate-binding domain-containing protein [Terrilactibacillus laevilacticus]
MKKTMVFAIIMMLLVLSACGQSNTDATKKKTLTMGTSADYPPFEFVNSKEGENGVQGFDVDVAKYITKQLGYKLEIKNMDFDGLIASLNTNRTDFVISGMTPNEKRKKVVDFSVPYYSTKQVVLTTKNNNIKTIEDLKGKTVGVQLGSVQQKIADEINKKTKIEQKQLNKLNELVELLKSNRVNAVLSENTVARGYVANNPNLVEFDVPFEAPSDVAIAFPKDSKLRAKFDKEIKKMKENGKMAELEKKWFENNK